MGWPAKCSDEEFIQLFRELGPKGIADRLGQGQRGVYERRRTLERKYKQRIPSPTKSSNPQPEYKEHPGRICVNVENGFVLVGSDAHYWPGPPSLMHRAFVHLCKRLKPKVVILNGDVIDACSISTHPPIGWASMPTIQQEIEAAQARLNEIELAAGKVRKLWPLGNHDSRFETKLATVAPEFAKVVGSSLSDHFPLWEPCWSVFINDNIVVKHRYKGGMHAPHNNTVSSGRTIVTGHLHSAKVIPWDDYNGTRYGMDTGCIADPQHRAFLDYMEDNPRNWREGIGVLELIGGKLKPPDLVLRWNSIGVIFRGEIIKV
jgi:hypothetical protein